MNAPVACSQTIQSPQDMARHKRSEPESYADLTTQSAIRQKGITL